MVEVLLATILIALISAAFFASLLTCFNYLRRVIELRTASLVLQEEVSKVRELTFSDIQSLGGTFSSSGMSSLNNAAGAILQGPYEGRDKIVKITFQLDWTAFDGKPVRKTLVTLMTDHGINKR
jgi:hypothetical protein